MKKTKYIIYFIALALLLVGCGKNNEEPKEEPKSEKIAEVKKEQTPEDLVAPFISLLYRGCNSEEYFYIKETTTYDNLKKADKVEIAYQALTEGKDLEEFSLTDLDKSFKRVFGETKSIIFPSKLDIETEMANYKLEGTKYVLEANGGGCLDFEDKLYTKIIETKKEESKMTIRVNYAVRSIKDKAKLQKTEKVDESKIKGTLYSAYNKKKILLNNIEYSKEDEEINKILEGDKTNYIMFTFTKENDNYIFNKAELVER